MSRFRHSGHPAPRLLLTGTTGLLGAALLPELLERGFRVLAVARRRGKVSARERVRRILGVRELSVETTNRVEVIDTELEGGMRASLARRPPPHAVIHAAAAVKFTTSFEELLWQNVTATERLLDVIYELAPRAEFHFISTAYVGGCHRGTFRESDPGVGRGFHHAYEETKFLAERGVTRHCLGTKRPFSIYRPSIISGSSRDGSAANFNGIYAFLRPLDILARTESESSAIGTGVSFCCDPEATKNLVPVDWVASSIGALVEKGASGKTYHLTHPRPVAHAALLDMVRQLPGLERLQVSARASCDAPTHRAQKLVDRSLRGLTPYLWGEPRFDRTNLEADLGLAAEPPPADRDYFSRILEFGRSVQWHERPFEGEWQRNGGVAPGVCSHHHSSQAPERNLSNANTAHGIHSGPR